MLNKFRPVMVITRREIRDQFRDWRIIIPILLLTLLFPAIMNFTAGQVVGFVDRYGADIVGERLIPFLLMVVGFFPISVSMVIALESFVGEKERRSIEPLLASPLEDWHLYLGKLIAVMFPPLVASYLGITVYLLGLSRDIGWNASPILLVQIIILTSVQALVMVSGAVVISAQATSVRAANLLASFIIIPMAFVIQGESMVMFWAQYDVLWWVIIGMVVLAGLLIRTGVSHFNREELLGRELDTLNLRGGWRTFWQSFKGEATSLRSWYRIEVFPLVGRMKIPILLLTVLMGAAILIGMSQADAFPLPENIFDPESIQLESLGAVGTVDFLTPQGAVVVWYHNVRAIVLSLVLGIISFGVFGLLTLMLPLMLIGYFMATFSTFGISPMVFLGGLILPHGILEIPAIILAGAALIRMGARIASPWQGRTIGEAWLSSFADWTKILLGLVVPLLLGAAILEVFVTPRVAVLLLR